jgi:hypothetical protein
MAELTAQRVYGLLLSALTEEHFSPVRTALRGMGVDDAALCASITEVDERPETRAVLQQLRGKILGPDMSLNLYLVEHYALLVAASHSMTRLATLPVPGDVTQLFLQEFARLANPQKSDLNYFDAEGNSFAAVCKLVTLRRYPAGQFHWEVSGLERSSFSRIRGLDRMRLATAILRLGGISPMFFPHMPWRKQIVLLEKQQLLSYYRMAEAMRRQPRIRGLIAESWIHSPDTPTVSPHLAFVNRVFNEWGGVVVRSGPAGPLSGVFEGGALRKKLAEEGTFTPTLGLAVWPRRAMLHWAAHYASNAA